MTMTQFNNDINSIVYERKLVIECKRMLVVYRSKILLVDTFSFQVIYKKWFIDFVAHSWSLSFTV